MEKKMDLDSIRKRMETRKREEQTKKRQEKIEKTTVTLQETSLGCWRGDTKNGQKVKFERIEFGLTECARYTGTLKVYKDLGNLSGYWETVFTRGYKETAIRWMENN